MDFRYFRREAVLMGLLIAGVIVWQVINRSPAQTPVQASLMLVPAPTQAVLLKGEFTPGPGLRVLWSGESAESEARFFAGWLAGYTGFEIPVEEAQPGQEPANRILFRLVREVELSPEGYRLDISTEGIEISAVGAAGLFYATQTLRQMLDDGPGLPACSLLDTPAFSWRGLLLDASRHFWTPDQVRRVIDQLAYHKMNVLHWHLTDDQGWRLAVELQPRLAQHAAWRTEPDGSRYGGFYTAEQVREIVAYAAQRHVTVVPEIEMPGHSQAALAAYPELSCTGGPHEVWNDWGVSKEIFCAGNEATFLFLQSVLVKVTGLFPSAYVHLGGDEVPVARWEACPRCEERRLELELPDAHALQSWFLRRIADSLALQNRQVIGWDETAEGPLLHPQAIVQVWRDMDFAEAAIRSGHRVIASPTSHAYFDYGLESIDLKKVFEFNPVPEAFRGRREAALVLGGAANAWSEHIPDQAALDDRLFPRLLAMAEVLWHGPGAMAWPDFHVGVQHHYNRLEKLGIAFGAETVPLRFESAVGAGGGLDIRLIPGMPDADIFYVEGRTVPDSTDRKVSGDTAGSTPIRFSRGDHSITARAYRRGRPSGETITREFRLHAALGVAPKLAVPWTAPYDGGGAGALTDGRLGTDQFRDGIWQGYFGADLDATLDLGVAVTVDSVLLGAFQYINSWIFLPRRVRVYAGTIQGNLELISIADNPVSPHERNRFVRTFVAAFPAKEVRYIRVVAESLGTCPAWHEAAGNPAWLFIDEIAVR